MLWACIKLSVLVPWQQLKIQVKKASEWVCTELPDAAYAP